MKVCVSRPTRCVPSTEKPLGAPFDRIMIRVLWRASMFFPSLIVIVSPHIRLRVVSAGFPLVPLLRLFVPPTIISHVKTLRSCPHRFPSLSYRKQAQTLPVFSATPNLPSPPLGSFSHFLAVCTSSSSALSTSPNSFVQQ